MATALILLGFLRFLAMLTPPLSSDRIDRQENVIHITKKLSYAHGQTPKLEAKLKSKNGRRDVPLLPPLAAVLPKDHIGLIFPGETGDYMKAGEIRKAWHQYCRDVGLNCTRYNDSGNRVETFPVTPHCFRHNFATICFEAQIDPRQAAEIIGDRRETVEAVYTHLRDQKRKTGADLLAEYVSKEMGG